MNQKFRMRDHSQEGHTPFLPVLIMNSYAEEVFEYETVEICQSVESRDLMAEHLIQSDHLRQVKVHSFLYLQHKQDYVLHINRKDVYYQLGPKFIHSVVLGDLYAFQDVDRMVYHDVQRLCFRNTFYYYKMGIYLWGSVQEAFLLLFWI